MEKDQAVNRILAASEEDLKNIVRERYFRPTHHSKNLHLRLLGVRGAGMQRK